MPSPAIMFRILLFFIVVSLIVSAVVWLFCFMFGLEFKFFGRTFLENRKQKEKYYDRKFDKKRKELDKNWSNK